jgi:WhiB family redox-sensing transcriptional regulator
VDNSRGRLALPPTPAWYRDAFCATTYDPDLFYPEEGRRGWTVAAQETLAKRQCAQCKVREQCLQYAMERPEIHGIWGGLTARQRKRRAARLRGAA